MTQKSFLIAAMCWFFAALVFAVPNTSAQSFSAQGISQESETSTIKQCSEGAVRAQERVLTLQNRVNTILNCNRQGQVYDRNAGICITPGLAPDHVFENTPSGDTLAMINPDGSTGIAAVLGGRNGATITCVENPAGCVFAGNTLNHGDTVTAYRNSGVPFGDDCNAATNVETRSCNNGTLTGSFTNDSCATGTPNSCTAPWGETIAHGASVTAYETNIQPATGECNSQQRTCNNGTLSGTFTFNQCEPTTAHERLLFLGEWLYTALWCDWL